MCQVVDTSVTLGAFDNGCNHLGNVVDGDDVLPALASPLEAKGNGVPGGLVGIAEHPVQQLGRAGGEVSAAELRGPAGSMFADHDRRTIDRERATARLRPRGTEPFGPPLAPFVVVMEGGRRVQNHFFGRLIRPAAHVGGADQMEAADVLTRRPRQQAHRSLDIGSLGFTPRIGAKVGRGCGMDHAMQAEVPAFGNRLGQVPLDDDELPTANQTPGV